MHVTACADQNGPSLFFHICELALFVNTWDWSLDADVFFGVLVENIWVEENPPQ